MPDIRLILHPTDFSENSRYAFQTACALARESDATLLVLHIMLPSVSPIQEAPLPDPLRSVELQESLPTLPWPQASDPRVRVDHRLAEGEPAEEILRLTRTLGCDLIVMGTHGRTGLGRFLTGSVAEEVLRKADCPVLVVKAPLIAAPEGEAETIANPGDLVDLRSLGTARDSVQTRTMVRTSSVQVIRLIVRTGQDVPQSASRGETLVQCLDGRAGLTALGKTQTLDTGNLVLLPAGERYAFHGIEDASLLLTILDPKP
jgi:universal stress protein A